MRSEASLASQDAVFTEAFWYAQRAVDVVRCEGCGTFDCGVGAPGLLQFEERVLKHTDGDINLAFTIKAYPLHSLSTLMEVPPPKS